MMRLLLIVGALGLAHLAESGSGGPRPFHGHNQDRLGNERQTWSGHYSIQGPKWPANANVYGNARLGGHRRRSHGDTNDYLIVPTGTVVKPASSIGMLHEEIETKSLDELYTDAKKEGCKAIVYAGGDIPGQQDGTKAAFEARFPNCTLEMIVDYSKFHGPRINMQIENNSLIPDVVQLQTLQDFPRWANEGQFMNYKPNGWEFINDEWKDPEGRFVPLMVLGFTNCVNRDLLPDQSQWPTEAQDYLRPDLNGKISITYPNDDDAILFLFKKFIDKYGWEYLVKLNAQNVTWSRGSHSPGVALREERAWVAPAAGCSLLNPPTSTLTAVLPKEDPFMTWAQTAAIFEKAKHPATAKLYLNFILSKDYQTNNLAKWSVRSDVPPPGDLLPLASYKNQTDPTEFKNWMENRALVEELKARFSIIIGEPQGEPTPGKLGLCPTKALPH